MTNKITSISTIATYATNRSISRPYKDHLPHNSKLLSTLFPMLTATAYLLLLPNKARDNTWMRTICRKSIAIPFSGLSQRDQSSPETWNLKTFLPNNQPDIQKIRITVTEKQLEVWRSIVLKWCKVDNIGTTNFPSWRKVVPNKKPVNRSSSKYICIKNNYFRV